MDKNTVWAIVLSTLVVIGAFLLPPILFPDKYAPAQGAVTEAAAETESPAEEELGELALSEQAEDEDESAAEEQLAEQTYTVKTNLAEITLTNRGGDIISYLLDESKHKDTETGKGVQLADNVSSLNRACAVSFGPAENRLVNEIFTTEKIDDYTYLFKKSFSSNGKKYTLGKKYTFTPDEYAFKLELLIHCNDGTGLNFDGVSYTLRTSPQIGPHFDAKQNRYENRQFIAFNGTKAKKVVLGQNQYKRYDKDIEWGGIAGKYFVNLIVPSAPENISGGIYSSRIEVNDYANAQAFFERKAFSEGDIQDVYYLYFGPRDEKELKRYNSAGANVWGLSGKKLTESLQTMGWLSWLETILKVIMEFLYKFIPNWGVTIIILTILLKLLMFPLSRKQSLGTLKMQQIQPQLQTIQNKYKDDPQRLQAETQKLYQQAGYNPASGCLPMLFQFLILFAMYNLFNNYFEFRGAMFIPGWIPDLSVGDSVYTLNFNIPLLGNQIRILPVIYVATQLLFGKITQNGGMSSGQNAATMKFMTYGMPLLFFFLFYNAPSGLLLYWTVSNIFQMGQQIVINRMMQDKKEALAAEGKNRPAPAKANKRK